MKVPHDEAIDRDGGRPDPAPDHRGAGWSDWRDRGDAAAIIEPVAGRVTSYAELHARLERLLDHLGPVRQVMLVEATPTLSTIILYLAAWVGRHVVILCPPDRPEEMARLNERFAPGIVAAAGDDADAVARVATTPDAAPSSPVHPALALLLPTSGSTGAAKAVRLSRDNLIANAHSISAYLDIDDSERALLNLPIHYSYGLSVLNSHLLAGAAVILDPRSLIEPELWADAARLGATSFAGVPYSYELLEQVDLAARAPSTLRYFTQAGGRLPPERAARFGALARARGWRFFIMYGQTEATARMAYLPPDKLESEPDAIGRAIPGGAFSLRDEQGDPVEADNTVGELMYSGPNVMMGYATQIADLALPAQPPLLATGDMAMRLPSGLYRITGRKSRFVKIFGNRIDLDEVERMLERAGIAAIATGNDERLVVAVADEAARARAVPLLAPALKLPSSRIAALVLPDPPRLASGKVDHPRLRALIEERLAAETMPATRADDDGQAIRTLFARTFGDGANDDEASFLSLGGDSLTYVTMAMALEDRLGSLPDGWEAMTVGELASRADRPNGTAPAAASSRVRDNLDTLRGMACLLVVAFHVIGIDQTTGMALPMTSWWHVAADAIDFVRMPLFTAMAGYFYALMPGFDEPRGVFVRRKARSLLVPAMFVGTILWSLRAFMGMEQAALPVALAFGFMHLWYLNALFAIFVVIAALERRAPMSSMLVAVLIALGLFAATPVGEQGAYFLRNVLYLLPYFLLGICLKRSPEPFYSNGTTIAGASLSLLVLGMELLWRARAAPLPWFEPFLVALAGFAVVPPLFRLMPRIPFFAWIGAYSITIYLWHPLANGAVRSMVVRVTQTSWVEFVTGMAAGVVLPIILHRLVRHRPAISLPLIGR